MHVFSVCVDQGNPNSVVPEVQSIIQGVGMGRTSNDPLVILGHKANFGHTVSAAGVVAVVVSSLALWKRQIPGHLNVTEPMKQIREFDGLMLPESKALMDKEQEAYSSISGTSASGDNVHFVLQQHSQHRQIYDIEAMILELEVLEQQHVKAREFKQAAAVK